MTRRSADGSSLRVSDEPDSILIVKPSSFGDVVHTLPAVARLKAVWPNAHLAWLVNSEWAPLLKDNPSVDEIVLFPRQNFRGWSGGFEFRRWCQHHLATRKPSLTVDFQGLLRSAWMGRQSRPRCFVGMSDAREGAVWFYDRAAPMPSGRPHAVERYLATTDEALHLFEQTVEDSSKSAWEFPLPTGTPPDSIPEEAPSRFILLHPFARGHGKSLSDTHLRQLCEQLSPRHILLVGKRGESSLGLWPKNCTNLLDRTTLPQLIWLLRQTAAVVTVDSGPSHLAAALGRPMIAIHTWSDPRQVGPYRPDAWVWKNGALLQMRQFASMEEAFFHQRTRGLTERDIPAIAGLAISL